MPEQYLDMIEQIASSTGLKKSDITRMAIKKFLDEYSSGTETDIFNKAKHLIGIVKSGISDLGQNHRSHLINRINKGS